MQLVARHYCRAFVYMWPTFAMSPSRQRRNALMVPHLAVCRWLAVMRWNLPVSGRFLHAFRARLLWMAGAMSAC